MADPPVGPGTHATSWPERVAAASIPTVLAVAAFTVSFSNVREVAAVHGAAGWRSWPLAASVELMAIGAALEVRRRNARRDLAVMPWLVLLVGVGVTIAANLEHATAAGWGTVVAVWPACAYLLAASLKATRPAVRTPSAAVPDTADDPPTDAERKPSHLTVVDPLLEPARMVLAELSAPSRTALGKALRNRGHALSRDREIALWKALGGEAA